MAATAPDKTDAVQEVHPQLAKLVDQLDDVSDLTRGLVEGLTADQMRLRPDPDRWSVAECLVHLNLCSESFVPLIARACEDAREKQVFGPGPFKLDGLGRLLKWTLQPPARIKVRTSEKFEPGLIGLPEEILPRFLILQTQLQRSIAQAEGLNLNKVLVISPFSKRMKYNLFSCFVLIVTHQLRHLWQAENVKRALLREV
jgi:hypothetical protein